MLHHSSALRRTVESHFRLYLLGIGLGALVACFEPQNVCTSDDECFTDLGYLCDSGDTGVCLPGCSSQADCVQGTQTCDLTDPERGMCRNTGSNSGGGGGSPGGGAGGSTGGSTGGSSGGTSGGT